MNQADIPERARSVEGDRAVLLGVDGIGRIAPLAPQWMTDQVTVPNDGLPRSDLQTSLWIGSDAEIPGQLAIGTGGCAIQILIGLAVLHHLCGGVDGPTDEHRECQRPHPSAVHLASS